MPMGFAAILGGTLTLVASGPLILLNDLLASSARDSTRTSPRTGCSRRPRWGSPCCWAASPCSPWPVGGCCPPDDEDRTPDAALPGITARYGLTGELHPVRVPEGSRLVGRPVEDIEAATPGVLLAGVQTDGGGTALAPRREQVVEAGMVLALAGEPEAVDAVVADEELVAIGSEDDPFAHLRDPERNGFVEVTVRPGSGLAGQQVRDLRLRVRFGMALLAVHHRGEVVAEGLRERRLAAGDVLVFYGPWDRVARPATRDRPGGDQRPPDRAAPHRTSGGGRSGPSPSRSRS
jgi:Trk K+ transport system NAD-binding subunit